MSHGVRIPDGIVAAYPATLLTTDASPSRLLTLIDPLLPLSVLYKCIDAYAGELLSQVMLHTVLIQYRLLQNSFIYRTFVTVLFLGHSLYLSRFELSVSAASSADRHLSCFGTGHSKVVD